MSNFTTSADLLKYALRAAGEIDNGNSPIHSIALEHLNLNYIRILGGANIYNLELGDPFIWARTSKTLELLPIYETGTIALTKGSTSGTLSVAPTLDASNISVLDYDLKVEDSLDWFKITAHSSGSTSVTLDAGYNGDTGTYSFKLLKLRYDLGASIIRLVEPLRVYRNQGTNDEEDKIYKVEANTFRKDFPKRKISLGIPDTFTLVSETDAAYVLEMNKYTNVRVKVDVEVVVTPTALTDSGSSIPIIPLVHRKSLGDMTAASILQDEKKQAKDAGVYVGYAKQGLQAMITVDRKQNQQTGKYRGRLITRL
jgi:hypothetical protein